MDEILSAGIQAPPPHPLKFSPPSFRESHPFNPKIFQPPPPFLFLMKKSQWKLRQHDQNLPMEGSTLYRTDPSVRRNK